MGPDPGIPLEQQPAPAIERMNLYAEARGEGPLGMLAVWHVVANRAARRDTTRAEEIMRPLQFSWTRPSDPNYRAALNGYKADPVLWGICDAICSLAEAGYTIDPTGGALNYYAPLLCSPAWGRGHEKWRETAVIGRHVFGVAG